MKKGYRILSIEACDIYRHSQENGKAVGYKLPQRGTDAYCRMFKTILDESLDTIELKRVYADICGEPFSFQDRYQNVYTRAVVNVKFNYKYSPDAACEEENAKDTIALREYFYQNGFSVDGIRYIRYKRSAGSSRDGKCMFIDERLYDAMVRWGECGLTATNDLASWEAYKALSLSAIKGTFHIPIEGILFVKDYQDKFTDEVVAVKLKDGQLDAQTTVAEIDNNIWDGESLLDESLFTGDYSEKHMLLLRNKFFKSCGFRTKLKKWIKDKGITLDSLKARGFVTLATDISQIVMVTTPSSFKYLKFAGGAAGDELSQKDIQNWASHVDGTFGVVKWDKRTRFFGGRMVRSSYQLLNTIGLKKEQTEQLLQPSKDYLALIRGDVDFMRYHFSDAYAKESDGNDDEDRDARDRHVQRADVLFRLMKINDCFEHTELYSSFRNEMVKNQKDHLLAGHILLNGTNATLFGNGPELLKYIAGEEKLTSVLKPGQIRCEKFPHEQKLLCARSPHITMGNLYCVENNREGEIWDYFDLGENVVCVNAIGENIQQRLNGCDYDSDAMLITDNRMLIETANRYAKYFKVPVCKIKSSRVENVSLADLDHKTSANKIGEIVNLSQKLNSIIWDKLNRGDGNVQEIYLDVCKLAVLSGIEIDKAKRSYDKVNAGKELDSIRDRYEALARPGFFKPMDDERNARYSGEKNADEQVKVRTYYNYATAMQYIYDDVSETVDFRHGKPKTVSPIPISCMLKMNPKNIQSDCAARDEIFGICEEYREKIQKRHKELRKVAEDERDVIYDNILDLTTERNEKIAKLLTNENILLLVIEQKEREWLRAQSRTKRKAIATDWYIYGPLLENKTFQRILQESREKLATIIEDSTGEYTLYGFHYRKT